MYYFQDPKNRERRVTHDISRTYLDSVARAIGIKGGVYTFSEFQKALYSAEGDVDLLIYHEPFTPGESLIACEIKTSYLDSAGKLKSGKPKKSLKQLRNLEADGFDYVWLLEFVVTEPGQDWFHPQAADGVGIHTADLANLPYGHAKFQICGVAGRPEADAGSITYEAIQLAQRLPRNRRSEFLLETVREQVKVQYGLV